VRSYRDYLAENPSDSAIWVQLGHCLKESGSYRDAETAYDRALALTPEDDDIYLHRGHLAKLTGSTADAVYFYKKSLSLRREEDDALKELSALGALDTIREVLPSHFQSVSEVTSTVYLDITDLIDYVKINTSLSGIQRVISNLAKFDLQQTPGGDARKILLGISEYDHPEVYSVNTVLVRNLVELLEHSSKSRREIDDTIRLIYDSRQHVELRAGDVFVMAGAFWIYREMPGYPGANYDVIAALRARGVHFGLFIHDLIQIRNPEYVHKEATTVFRKSLIDALTLANFVLTNSRYVANEVNEFLQTRLNFDLPIKAVPLATELRVPISIETRIDPEIRDVCRGEFILCVCTIEVRKNHLYLIKIWERLVKEFGRNVPNLVFVGKWGWDIEGLQEYLARTDALGSWLYVFNGISDSELEYLYRHCLFTAFVSFAEGWGLPVGESLAHGKPCVASNTTSIPEVGGDLVRYVDPFDHQEGYRVIKQLVTDRAELDEWTERVRREFRPKRWQTFSAEFFEAIDGFCQDDSHDSLPNNCILPSGELLFIGDDDVDRLDIAGSRLVTFRMARAGGWHPIEHWGVWASQRRARLRFRTDLSEGEPVKIYLRLQEPPGSDGVKCTIRAGAVETLLDALTTHATFYQANGRVGSGGVLEITLAFAGKFGKPDQRDLYLGLSAFGLSGTEDALARIELLEQVTLCQITHPRYSIPDHKPTAAPQEAASQETNNRAGAEDGRVGRGI